MSDSAKLAVGTPPSSSQQNPPPNEKTRKTPTRVPGNLPYLTSSGTLKRVLEKAIQAAKPDKFNIDFVENMLKITGGAARASIPIIKRMGFATTDGTPTELYSKFRTTSGRPEAALAGLRNGFPEVFKRSDYAHTVGDSKLRDVIVEITGLKPNDPIVTAIKSTFNVINSFIPSNFVPEAQQDDAVNEITVTERENERLTYPGALKHDLRLAYNINIVLPETSDLRVLNAIFKSLKENLLQ